MLGIKYRHSRGLSFMTDLLCYARYMEPKEYKEGFTEFLGCKIDLAKHPLIPRPETEFWTQKAIETIQPQGEASGKSGGLAFVPKILDLFTGSGCIGIAVASKIANAHVTLADKTDYISTQLPKKVTFRKSDLFSNIPEKYDFILANPPYVPEGKGVKGIMEHEPHATLYAGKDGLDVIKPFLEQVREHLNPSGQIWLEFGTDQKEAITNILRELNYYQSFNISFHKDQHDKWRWVVVTA